ncbi:hypothetical protein EG329_003130 [Mollisiaceae sp. DMI_Dod_QoI]|nr:hypothetical protein EG329_003130 [Helotiales sp. DMI_Dod_QoI]
MGVSTIFNTNTYLTPTSAPSLSGVALPTSTPSTIPENNQQGTIQIYKSKGSCSDDGAFSDNGIPLLLNTCMAMPLATIFGIEILHKPTCPNEGTAWLAISTLEGCESNAITTTDTNADGGTEDKCYYFSNSSTIMSVQFQCVGYGVTNVTEDEPQGGSGGIQTRSLKRGSFLVVLLALVMILL